MDNLNHRPIKILYPSSLCRFSSRLLARESDVTVMPVDDPDGLLRQTRAITADPPGDAIFASEEMPALLARHLGACMFCRRRMAGISGAN